MESSTKNYSLYNSIEELNNYLLEKKLSKNDYSDFVYWQYYLDFSHKNRLKSSEDKEIPEKMQKLFFDFISHPNCDLRNTTDQSLLMHYWWTHHIPNIPALHMDNNISDEKAKIFYSQLDSEKLVPILKPNFKNYKGNNKKYNNQLISWIHFGLMENWTLVQDMSSFVNMEKCVNLNNSLNESTWHVMAYAIGNGYRPEYDRMFELLKQYSTVSLDHKDIYGKTVFDIVESNILTIESSLNKSYRNSDQEKKQLEFNYCFKQKLEKLKLHESLTTKLHNKNAHYRVKI